MQNAIDSANLMPGDVLLLDVSIQGKAYVLAVAAKNLNLQDFHNGFKEIITIFK